MEMSAGKYNACANSEIEYWLRKVNTDKIIWEKLFDRSTDHKLVNFDFNWPTYRKNLGLRLEKWKSRNKSIGGAKVTALLFR